MISNNLTVVGNLTAEPVLRTTPSGDSVATLRLASNSRYLDPASNEWRDSDVLYLSVVCWRSLAVNAAHCLRKGDRVVASGRLKCHDYEADGVKRTVYELAADAVGPDLGRAPANVQRSSRPNALTGNGPVGEQGGDVEELGAESARLAARAGTEASRR